MSAASTPVVLEAPVKRKFYLTRTALRWSWRRAEEEGKCPPLTQSHRPVTTELGCEHESSGKAKRPHPLEPRLQAASPALEIKAPLFSLMITFPGGECGGGEPESFD